MLPKTVKATLVASVFLFTSCIFAEDTTVIPIIIKTEFGNIEAELYPEKAPVTVANFLANIAAGLYTPGHFYRVATLDGPSKIGVIEGGRFFNVSNSRKPIKHETTDQTGLSNIDGTLGMAREDPGTADASFFINIGDNSWKLDYLPATADKEERPGYAVFGQVTKGMEIARKIQSMPFGNREFSSAEIDLINSFPEKTRKTMGNYLKQWLNQSVTIQAIEVH